MLLRSTALALAAALLAAVPAMAVPLREPRLVPQVSLRGVQVGMIGAEVRKAVGRAPDDRRTARHPVLGKTTVWRFGRMTVTFDGARTGSGVISVITTSRRDRTASGIGVGSAEAAVRAGVRGVRCETELGYRHCWVGRFRPGQLVTDFSIGSTGRVTKVLLGRVID